MNHLNSIQKSYSSQEELLNASSHGLGFLAAALATILMFIKVQGLVGQIACGVYGLSMMLMFLSSTFYHLAQQAELKAKLKVFDHSAIYLLIAGTYTPFMVLAVGGTTGGIAMLLIWSIAFIGIGFKCLANKRFPKLSVITYLLMGWLAVFYIYPLYNALSTAGFWMLVAGGLCYTLGVLFYVAKTRQFTHAIWHVFVVAGCACHFGAIYYHVI